MRGRCFRCCPMLWQGFTCRQSSNATRSATIVTPVHHTVAAYPFEHSTVKNSIKQLPRDRTMELCGTVDQFQLTVKLLELQRDTKYEIVQENGQRRLTAPEFTAESNDRAKGSEVFLGRLPRDCYECELMPVLARVGKLLELRLMLDFSGSTRGYAFALFENPSTARRACQMLDGYEIRPGHRIGVVKSIDNCRLFFGGVPKDKTKAEFMNELGNMLEGIIDIYMYPNAQDRTQNRGFIFVEFKDHRAAAMARRKLIPGRIVLWNRDIAVDWADPEPGEPMDDELMESVTALFVRNICPDISQQRVRTIFQKATGKQILKIKKINHFAFIHYENRETAQLVMDIMTVPGSVADQEKWEIRWAKPIGSTRVLERQRYIKESLTTCSSAGDERASSKSSGRKKRGRKTRAETASPDSCLTVSYQQALELFVADNMHASCLFQCYDASGDGYTCKVLVTDRANVIFEFQGSFVFASTEKAVEETARELYEHLHLQGENNELWLSHTPSHSSGRSNSPLRNKIEACR